MCNIRPVLSTAVTLFHCGPVIKVILCSPVRILGLTLRVKMWMFYMLSKSDLSRQQEADTNLYIYYTVGRSLLNALAVIVKCWIICWFVSVHVICGMLLSAQQWMRNTTCRLFNVDLFDSSVQTQSSTLYAYRARNVLGVSQTDAGFQLSIEMPYPAAPIFCSFSFAVRYANVISTAKRLKLSRFLLALLPCLALWLLFTSFYLTKWRSFCYRWFHRHNNHSSNNTNSTNTSASLRQNYTDLQQFKHRYLKTRCWIRKLVGLC